MDPSAITIVARQRWSNSHFDRGSSSKVSIKATQSGIEQTTTHTKESSDITTQNISYNSEFAAEFKIITSQFRIVKYYIVLNYYRSLEFIIQWKIKSTTTSDT